MLSPYKYTPRKVSKDEIKYVRRRDGYCLAGLFLKDGCVEGFDVHHIKTRGSGGDDDRTNMLCLCRKHHQDAHSGRITKQQLRDWLKELYGYKTE